MNRYYKERKERSKRSIDKSLAVLFQPSIASSLFEEDVMFNDGTVGKYRHDDIYLLFNQQRLNALGSDTINQWVSSLQSSKNSELSQLLDKCTDEQKISLIKSRHIQSASELQAWDNFLTSVSDVTVGNIRNYIESLKASDSGDNGEPNKDTSGNSDNSSNV